MKIVGDAEVMQREALAWRRAGRRIGFVPTMGYLHAGHLSLIRMARARADVVVVSLFVNPLQFGPGEDLARYPRDLARDERLCREAGVDVLFYPAVEAMYAPDRSVNVEETRLSLGLCGASRPGHFRGVATVVAKLFNLVQPDVAVFGEKDAQQLRVIRRMVRDLSFPVEIVPGPTVREPDGLAMSSRNARLSGEERVQAVCLRRALDEAERAVAEGERDVARIAAFMRGELAQATLGKLDYLAFVDDETMEPVETIAGPVLVALAMNFSSARLIDNAVLRSGSGLFDQLHVVDL